MSSASAAVVWTRTGATNFETVDRPPFLPLLQECLDISHRRCHGEQLRRPHSRSIPVRRDPALRPRRNLLEPVHVRHHHWRVASRSVHRPRTQSVLPPLVQNDVRPRGPIRHPPSEELRISREPHSALKTHLSRTTNLGSTFTPSLDRTATASGTAARSNFGVDCSDIQPSAWNCASLW